jgi:adenine phosphoribosyltransferase
MATYYELKIGGLKRNLPIIPISKNTNIASFNIMGDVELVDKIADELVKKLKKYKFDYIVGPEVKVVPLIHELSKRFHLKNFIICRKSVKPYMISPVVLRPLSHFPKHIKPLVIDGSDKDLLKGKRVVIVDDVISTGVTIRMMKHLMEKVGAKVVCTAAVIKQGESQFDTLEDFFCLSNIPIFKSTK